MCLGRSEKWESRMKLFPGCFTQSYGASGTAFPWGKSGLRMAGELSFIFIYSEFEKGFMFVVPGKGELGVLFTRLQTEQKTLLCPLEVFIFRNHRISTWKLFQNSRRYPCSGEISLRHLHKGVSKLRLRASREHTSLQRSQRAFGSVLLFQDCFFYRADTGLPETSACWP